MLRNNCIRVSAGGKLAQPMFQGLQPGIGIEPRGITFVGRGLQPLLAQAQELQGPLGARSAGPQALGGFFVTVEIAPHRLDISVGGRTRLGEPERRALPGNGGRLDKRQGQDNACTNDWQ